jgi:hypothetical protein
MVSTTLPICGFGPANRLAPSLYGLAAQNLRVRLRAHVQSEAVLGRDIRLTAKRCTDFVHATTICRHHNTNFTHFEAAGWRKRTVASTA